MCGACWQQQPKPEAFRRHVVFEQQAQNLQELHRAYLSAHLQHCRHLHLLHHHLHLLLSLVQRVWLQPPAVGGGRQCLQEAAAINAAAGTARVGSKWLLLLPACALPLQI